MFRALALVLGLIASPAAAQQIVCVSSVEKADEAARLSGEQLVWIGETAGGVVMRFYRGQKSWTVMYAVGQSWCTAPHMLGVILQAGEA